MSLLTTKNNFKSLFPLLLFCISSSFGVAQHFKSLKNFEKDIAHLSIEQQVDTLKKACDKAIISDKILAKQFLDRALDISIRAEYDYGMVICYQRLGVYYIEDGGNLETAETYVLKSIEIAEGLDNPVLQCRSYAKLGAVYFFAGKHDKALQSFKKGEALAISADSKDDILDFSNNLGSIYLKLGMKEKAYARFYAILALDPTEELKSNVYNNLGALGAALKKYDSALYFYERSYELCDYLPNPNQCRLSSLGNVAALYIRQKEYRKSINTNLQLLAEVNEKASKFVQVHTYINIGIAYNQLDLYDSAIYYLQQGLSLARKYQLAVETKITYEKLTAAYRDLKQYEKAFEYSKMYNDIKDSLFNIENAKHMKELLAKYESERKEKEIAVLKQEKWQRELDLKNQKISHEKQHLLDSLLTQKKEIEIEKLLGENELQKVLITNNKLKNQKQKDQILLLQKEKELQHAAARNQQVLRQATVIGAVLILLPVIILLLVYKQRVRSKELLALKTEEVNRQKILELIKDHELKAIKANIDGQEREKERIAHELHDGIAGNLAGIKLVLAKIAEDLQYHSKLQKVIEKIDNTYKEVRTITHHLTPPAMKSGSFSGLIKDFLNGIADTNAFDIDFICHPQGELDSLTDSIKIEVYRILQELMNNIMKHADTPQVEIQLTLNDDYINLLVEDKGKGFEVDKVVSGIGLTSIRSRVTKLEGNINIDSTIGRGTIVDIDIPVKNVRSASKNFGNVR